MRERVRAGWRRWCATPRPRVWEGVEHKVRLFVAVLTATAWLAFAQGTVAVVTGGADPSGGRGRAAAVYSLVALGLAVAGTVFVVAYLRRPLRDDGRLPPSDQPSSPAATAAREQAARRLESWRRGF